MESIHSLLVNSTVQEGSSNSLLPGNEYYGQSQLSDIQLDNNCSLDDGHGIRSYAGRISASLIAGIISVVTVVGNLLVIVAFKYNKQLQTLSNYCLVSLAVSDFSTGLLSMPLYTLYLLFGCWPLGPVICDIWLSVDYVMHTASVANLLIISLDRYLSVMRPLKYRASRTPRKIGIMISYTWIIAILLWPPWIFAWPYIEGKRIVPSDACYVQFLKSNKAMTLVTSLITFYIPVTITTSLYLFIYRQTEKQKRLMRKAKPASKGYSGHREKNVSINRKVDNDVNKDTFVTASRINISNKSGYQNSLSVDESRNNRTINVIGRHLSLDGVVRDRRNTNAYPHGDKSGRSPADEERNNYLPRSKSITYPSEHKTSNRQPSDINKSNSVTDSLRQLSNKGSSINGLNSILMQSKSASKRHRSRNIIQPVQGETTFLDSNSGYSGPETHVRDDTMSLKALNKENNKAFLSNRQGVRQERKIVKVLSAILLALIVTFAPYYTVVMVEVYCNDCVNTVLYAIGK